MVKLDINKLREIAGEPPKQDRETARDIDPIKLQRMKLEEAQWRALGGGGEEKQEVDPMDKLAEKMYNDLRRKEMMRQIRSGSGDDEENKQVKELQRQLDDMRVKFEETERKRIEEERERKNEERFNRLEKMMLENGNKKGDGDSAQKFLSELEKMRTEDRTERERIRAEDQAEKARLQEIADLRDEMADHQSRLETMIREGVGKKDKGFIAELKEFRETEKTLNQLVGKKGEEGESVSETVDQIIDKGPKLAQSVRSIYDMAKGTHDEEDIDIGPMETIPENETPRGTTYSSAASKNEMETYVDQGYEIDDPDHPGNKMFVGQYKDYYINESGKALSKSAVALIAKTHPEQLQPTVQQAQREFYAQQAEARAKKPEPPAEQYPMETKQPEPVKETTQETPENTETETDEDVATGDNL